VSELHLPEIKRDDIVRSLSQIRLPGADLPEAVAKIDWPRIDVSSGELGKAMAGAAAAVHIGRPAPRSRWPLAVGALIVVGLAGWAILTSETRRTRLARWAHTIGEQISAVRSDRHGRNEIARDDPVAFDAAQTAPMQASPYAASTTNHTTDYPEGLGSNNGDGIPAVEETDSPT
jgi:hypothetical protein